jgi:hypothetical protein
MNPPNPNPTGWGGDEVDRVGAAEELRLASFRHDGSLRDRVTIWLVRDGAVENGVRFEAADHALDDQIDAAHRTKYRGYAASIIDRINSAQARATTMRPVPRPETPMNKEQKS